MSTPKTPAPADSQGDKKTETGQSPKARKELPLIATPNDQQAMEEEMADLFDEDRVTHQHGGTEPEAD
jgi:hypothetical protein